MQCAILAGGLGTRMRAWTERVPKALIPVCGRPFIDYQLAWLAAQDVREAVLLVGYKAGMIRDHVGEGGRSRLRVRYVCEGPELLGTAGALRLALDENALDPAFFVLYGDSYLPVDLAPVRDAFERSGADALMTVFRNDGRWDTSNVVFENGRVAVYDKHRRHPRAAEMRFIDYGLSLMRRDVIRSRVQPGQRADLAGLYRELSFEGRLAGFQVHRRFYEIGSPTGLSDFEGYARTERLHAKL